jgi:hypothetical protein
MLIGSKEKIAFEVGNKLSSDQQEVNIWISNTLVTEFDNCAYVPQFIHSVKLEAIDVVGRDIDDDTMFLDFGPTTDDVSVRGSIEDGVLTLAADYKGVDLEKVRIEVSEYIDMYDSIIEALQVNVNGSKQALSNQN